MKIRYGLLLIWGLTLLTIIFSFFPEILLSTLKFEEVLKEIRLLTAFIIPQLTMIMAFFFQTTDEDIQLIVSKSKANLYLAFCCILLYNLIFIALVIIFIMDPLDRVVGEIQYSQSANIIIEIMGILSIFSVIPMVYLFTRTGKKKS